MNQAINLMNSLFNKSQTVQQVADIFVLNYAPFAYELSKIIDKQFHDDKSDKKCLCINLICEILRNSHQKNCSRLFVKGLAQRLRYFLHSMSRNYVSEGVALQINRNVDSLKYKDLFCDEYFEKLQTLARKIKENSDPAIGNTLQKSFSFEENSKNYSRTFLSMVRDINKCQNLKPILDTYYEYVQIEKEKPSRININKTGSIDLQSSIRESEDSKGSAQSLQIKESKRQRLQKVIKQCHQHIFMLQNSMGEELKNLQQNINTSNVRNESQCNVFIENQIQFLND